MKENSISADELEAVRAELQDYQDAHIQQRSELIRLRRERQKLSDALYGPGQKLAEGPHPSLVTQVQGFLNELRELTRVQNEYTSRLRRVIRNVLTSFEREIGWTEKTGAAERLRGIPADKLDDVVDSIMRHPLLHEAQEKDS
jgi:hypothetical protein